VRERLTRRLLRRNRLGRRRRLAANALLNVFLGARHEIESNLLTVFRYEVPAGFFVALRAACQRNGRAGWKWQCIPRARNLLVTVIYDAGGIRRKTHLDVFG